MIPNIENYLPKVLRDLPISQEILDIVRKIFDDNRQDYYDLIYKYKDISKVSLDSVKDLFSELGYDYLAKFLSIPDNEFYNLATFMSYISLNKEFESGFDFVLNRIGWTYEKIIWWEDTPTGVRETFKLKINN